MSVKIRGLKVLGLTVVAALAMSIVASAASAESWVVGGSTLSGSQAVTCSSEGTLELKSKIGSTNITLTASGIECIEGLIFNEGGEAKDSGTLKFTGVTVDGASETCAVKGGAVTTKALNSKLVTNAALASGLGDEFTPASGETFATVTLEKCGALNGSFPVKGSSVGESNELKNFAATQPLRFNTASNSISSLKLGTNAATLFGTVNNTIGGGTWGAE